MKNEQKRTGNMDFWKFIFSIVIVLYHSVYLLEPAKRWDSYSLLRGGNIGVEFFAIVSGFLMAASAAKKGEIGSYSELGEETFHFIIRKIKVFFAYYCIAFILNFFIIELYTPGTVITAENTAYSIWGLLLMRMSGVHGYYPVAPAWYLSAMLLIMLPMYPLLRKYKKSFTHIIAPMAVIFGIGYLSQKYGDLQISTSVLSAGMIRMLMDISLGCCAYELSRALAKISFNPRMKYIFGVIELACFLGVILMSEYVWASQLQFIQLLLLAVGVTIGFSGQSVLTESLSGKWTGSLANWSLIVYFCHTHLAVLIRMEFSSGSYYRDLLSYALLIVIMSAVCKAVTEWLFLPLLRKIKGLILSK